MILIIQICVNFGILMRILSITIIVCHFKVYAVLIYSMYRLDDIR